MRTTTPIITFDRIDAMAGEIAMRAGADEKVMQIAERLALAATAYSASRRTLYLRFHSGEVYRYFTFPAERFQQFLDADSQGRYFLGQIRDCFPYQRLPRR